MKRKPQNYREILACIVDCILCETQDKIGTSSVPNRNLAAAISALLQGDAIRPPGPPHAEDAACGNALND